VDNANTLSLLAAYREGDDHALRLIFDGHERLLTHIVHRYKHYSEETYEELRQVGYVGLLKAARGYETYGTYETGHEASFGSYAYAKIDGELRHHLRDNGLVKRPRWARSLHARISEATVRLSTELGRLPLPGEVAEEVNLTTEGVLELLKLFSDTEVSSLDGSGEEVDLSAIRSHRHESFSLPVEDKIALEEALEQLTELQRRVVYLFFYKDLSQTEIGRRLGLPQRKVSRVIASSMKSMKKRITGLD
jgi:RNA polymerase sigma-B factor